MTKNEVPEFLTVDDVKNYLKISRGAAYGLTHRKDFPSCRFGGTIRISLEPFLHWVALNTYLPKTLREARTAKEVTVYGS